MKFKLGQTVKDQVTGFSGVVTGTVQYLTGCKQALVQPPCKSKNDFVSSIWFDEDRLTVTKEKPLTIKVENNGPDRPAPIR